MAKARGSTERRQGPRPGYVKMGEPTVEIEAWSHRDDGKNPTQVHFVMKLDRFPYPLVVRYKGPDTLGFLIEELARYRKMVWPDAEELDLSGTWVELE